MQRLSFFSSRFFWRVFLAYSALFVVCFVFIGWQVFDQLSSIRGTLPQEIFENEIVKVWRNILIGIFVGIVFALIFALILARKVAGPVAEMMLVCDAFRQGRYDARVGQLPRDEIGRLGDTLNRLGDEITNKIAQISVERAQLKSMLAGMVEGIIAVDRRSEIRFCNRAAYTLLGCTLDDCRGLKLDQVAGFDQLSAIVDRSRQQRALVEEELMLEFEMSMRLLEVHASFYEGAYESGVIIVLHDVTKVRALETIRRDFVANVSHEIKTPLTSIKGYVETLRKNEDLPPETCDRFLEKIERNADRLMALVRDVLSLAQIEEHEGNISASPVDVSGVMRQVLSQHEDLVSKKELHVEVLNNLDSPLRVLADREALFQICDNLITNAIRYTPQSGKITIALFTKENNGCISVRDTGIGIPKKYLARIFQRFYRVDKARSRELGGTGLGLSIVKHLVSSLGGQISVESEVGKGSCFSVSFPLAG